MIVGLLIFLALQCFKVYFNSIMLLTSSNTVSGDYDEEFYKRIKYNFKLHLLLCLKNGNWNRQDILQKIFMLEGYHQHKAVKHRNNWVHIHIKFNEELQTEKAVEFFTNLSLDLTAVSVDYLLRDWFSFEKRSNIFPSWTLAIVDVLGTTPKSLNFLTPDLLNYILKDFGQPYLTPYTAALKETHVQIMSFSMTEALAACMALGHWYKFNKRTDNFVYRVRINTSNKEAFLISRSGGTPEDTLWLDYFIHPKPGVSPAKFNWNCKGNYYTPFMCIPVLINGTQFENGIVTDHRQIYQNSAGTFQSHTASIETPELGTVTEISDPEMQVCSCSHIDTSAEVSPGCSHQSISQHVTHQEGRKLNRTHRTEASEIRRQVSMPNISRRSTVERETIYIGNSLVFERSKS